MMPSLLATSARPSFAAALLREHYSTEPSPTLEFGDPSSRPARLESVARVTAGVQALNAYLGRRFPLFHGPVWQPMDEDTLCQRHMCGQCRRLHHEGGPAVAGADGTRMWLRHGRLHRHNGPAVEAADGTRLWYWRGRMHRLDGPAAEHPEGSAEWYRHGRLHRTNGPAIELPQGYRVWSLHGLIATHAVLLAMLDDGVPISAVQSTCGAWSADWPLALRTWRRERVVPAAMYLLSDENPHLVSLALSVLAEASVD